jgi:hypothetical protein
MIPGGRRQERGVRGQETEDRRQKAKGKTTKDEYLIADS